ncbi:MAG: ATP synthase F1 subunit gamma [Enterobacterales bacterium]
MSNIMDIYNKILSIKNTQKITKAMEMVSASKMRKIKKHMNNCSHYILMIINVLNNIKNSSIEYNHKYLINKNLNNKIGYLIISTDRGLVGNLNINLFKKVLFDIAKWDKQGIKSEIALIGEKSVLFFNSIRMPHISNVIRIGDNPKLSTLLKLIKIMLNLYDTGVLDKIYIANNKFINNISYIPQIEQILPIKSLQNKINKKYWSYIYESDPKLILDELFTKYIESQVYYKVIENIASEQSARMVSMKNATENGQNIIHELQILHNKVRQSAITQEIAEIISGATAV